MITLDTLGKGITTGCYFHLYWKDKEGLYLGCNEVRAQALQISSNDIVGKKDSDFMPEELAKRIAHNESIVLKTNEMHIVEETFVTAQNTQQIFLVHRFPLLNELDQTIGTYCLAFDITNQKIKEETLLKEKEELETTLNSLLTHLPGHVYWKDLNSQFLGCNDLQAQSAGFLHREDLIGKTDYEMPWKEHALSLQQSDLKVIQTEKPLSFEEESQLVNSTEASTFLSKKTPLYNKNGKVIGVLGISIDITDRKKLEHNLKEAKQKAESANQVKSDFIANMSHDIRTPLTGIIGMTQEMFNEASDLQPFLNNVLLKDGAEAKSESFILLKKLVERIQEDSELLLGSSDELLQLLNEILETMRLESGKVSEKPESFDLRELVKHNIELLKPVASHKKLKLSFEIDETITPFFKGLRHYLDRALLNLLSNALKFTEKGFVHVKIQRTNSDTQLLQGGTINLQIIVEDSGIGIPKKDHKTIFDHFSRLTPSYQGLYKGAGLGLYTVKHYLHAMQATIEVDSELGKGTRFIIHLPLTVSDHSDREISPDKLELRKTPTIKPKTVNHVDHEAIAASVLVVEDNLTAARSVQSYLARFNCISEHAETGNDAIRKVEENTYDLILMDIGLPDLNGIEVTQHIRSMNHQTPILALTGHGNDPGFRQQALDAGMQEVFSKPLSPSALEHCLEDYVFKQRENLSFTEIQKRPSDLKSLALKVIDWNASLKLVNEDENLLYELVDIVNLDLKMCQQTLSKAYSIHDDEALRKELHRVRGGICYLSLPQLDTALSHFHEAVKANPQSDDELEKSYGEVQYAMNAFWEVYQKLH